MSTKKKKKGVKTAGGPKWTMLDFEAIFANARRQSEKVIGKQNDRIKKTADKTLENAKTKHNNITTPTLENAIERIRLKYLNKATVDFVTTAFRRDIGLRLRKIREQNELTLDDVVEELSDFWEVDRTTISRWENAKREVNLVYLIWFAQRYDVDFQWLLTGEKKLPNNNISAELRKKLIEALEISKKL